MEARWATMTLTLHSDSEDPVMFREYFVVRRGAEWWIVDDATSFGPHVVRNAAVEAAIAMAVNDAQSCMSTKVYVEEKLLGDMSLVYDSAVDRHELNSNSDEEPRLGGQDL
jgi:hypothetical protein